MPTGTPGARLPQSGSRAARRLYPLAPVYAGCGRIAVTERHHRDGDPLNNAPENIALLCRRCHMALDGRGDRFTSRGVGWQRDRAERQRVARAQRTACANGHPYTPATLRVTAKGKLICRICQAAHARASRARRRI